MFRRLAVISVFFTAAAAVAAPTPYDKINAEAAAGPIDIQQAHGITVLEGSGGNIGVLPGPDGLLMVDVGIAVSRQKIEAVLRQLSPGKIRYVINTHWHWDHSDGNAWAHEDGATLIAQANTARHLNESIRVVEWGHTFVPVPAAARPTVLVDDALTLNINGESVRICQYAASHTDGDLSVYFPKADVLFTGDTWWNGLYPFIDYVAGGSIDGMIHAANTNLELAGEHTSIVPGHGPIGTRAQLAEYRDMLVAIRGRVAELKQRGLSLNQVLAAKPTEAFDAKYGQDVIGPALFTALVYRGV
jgi:glyoxylase-like metal-dependent hydrolase (beta-lactamase superfamily II)